MIQTAIEKYPEFEPALNQLYTETILLINKYEQTVPESKMPYRHQMLLELLIEKLQANV